MTRHTSQPREGLKIKKIKLTGVGPRRFKVLATSGSRLINAEPAIFQVRSIWISYKGARLKAKDKKLPYTMSVEQLFLSSGVIMRYKED